MASDKGNLEKIGVFLERMATSEDEMVRELLNVSVLEPLVLEDGAFEILQGYLGKKTTIELQYWLNRYKVGE